MALVVKLQKKLHITDLDSSGAVELLGRAAIRAHNDAEFNRTKALIHEQQHEQLRKARKPVPVNKKALSMARVMTRDHIRQQQAKLAAEAQLAAEKMERKAAKEAAKEVAKEATKEAKEAIEKSTNSAGHSRSGRSGRGGRGSRGGHGSRGGGRGSAKSTPEALDSACI